MTITDYKAKVIELFKSGRATDEQWDEMASVVLVASEGYSGVPAIDESVGVT